jgi:serine/threonine-protein kinase
MSSATSDRSLLQLGRYVVLEHIAAGGMAAIYRARHEDSGQEVALKVLSPEYAENPIRLRRFAREARALQRLDHPNIVKLFECDFANEMYFLAMEYVAGEDLYAHVAARGKLPVWEVVDILMQSARALNHAYFQGIVHRDVKPSNVLLAHQDGQRIVKLTDFGLALDWTNLDEARLTKAGTTLGTVDYMAPEQARGSQLVDIRSDLYALGCTAYFMLTARAPFTEGGVADKLYKHVHVTPPDPRDLNPNIPDDLIVVLGKLLQKRPEDRYQTPSELLVALEKLRRPASLPLPASLAPELFKTEPAAPEDEVVMEVWEAAEEDEEESSGPPPSPEKPKNGNAPFGLSLNIKTKDGIAPLLRELEVQPLWSRIAERVSDALVFLSDPAVLAIVMSVVLAAVILFLLYFWPG